MSTAVVVAGVTLALKFALVPAVAWVGVKVVQVADAFKAKAEQEHKKVKFARVMDSLAHFVSVGAAKEATAVKAALDADKPLPQVGAITLQTLKDFLGSDGLAELKDVLGIVADDLLETHLAVVATSNAPQVVTSGSVGQALSSKVASALPQ